jgi:hypothetical protein
VRTVSLPGPTLQFLPPADEARKDKGQGKRKYGRNEAERPQNPARSHKPGRRAMRDLQGSEAPRSALG